MTNINCIHNENGNCRHGAILGRCIIQDESVGSPCVFQKENKRLDLLLFQARSQSYHFNYDFECRSCKRPLNTEFGPRPDRAATKKEMFYGGLALIITLGLIAWSVSPIFAPEPELPSTDYVGSVTNEPD